VIPLIAGFLALSLGSSARASVIPASFKSAARSEQTMSKHSSPSSSVLSSNIRFAISYESSGRVSERFADVDPDRVSEMDSLGSAGCDNESVALLAVGSGGSPATPEPGTPANRFERMLPFGSTSSTGGSRFERGSQGSVGTVSPAVRALGVQTQSVRLRVANECLLPTHSVSSIFRPPRPSCDRMHHCV
jgi:hypothetical protein